jgi:hypothetical protein
MRSLISLAAIVFTLILMPATGNTQAFHTEVIVDPALNMKAYDVFIPNGWKYQGTFMQGDSCSNLASPVWRAYSPDGLSEFRRLPRFDWSWSNAPYEPKPKGDCLPLTRDMSAADFVRYLGNILHLKFVGEAQEPEFASAFMRNVENDNAGIMAAAGQRPFRGSASAGRFEDQNGSFVIEEQIRAGVRCSHFDLPGFARQGKLFKETCGAEVRIVRAPKGKLDSLVASLNAHGGFHEDEHWTKTVISIMQQQMRANDEQTRRIMATRQTQFQHDQTVRAQQNEQYQAATQAGYARRNAQQAETQAGYAQHNANEMKNMEARHTPASDWVDYALDQQTVTGSGGVAVKVSSAYNQTWANGQGQYYQTNNPNADPNGALPGNWTKQTQVHGNGQP